MIHPVRNIELIKTAANAIVIWLVVMGIWPLTDVQQAATITVLMTLVNAIGGYFQGGQTTPLAKPEVKLESV